VPSSSSARRPGRGAGKRSSGSAPHATAPGVTLQVTFRTRTGYFTALWFGRPISPSSSSGTSEWSSTGRRRSPRPPDRARQPEFERSGRRAGLDSHGAGSAGLSLPRVSSRSSMRAAPARYRGGPRRARARHPAGGVGARRSLIQVAEAYRRGPLSGTLEESRKPAGRLRLRGFLRAPVGLAIKRRRQARELGGRSRPRATSSRDSCASSRSRLTPAQSASWSEIRSDLGPRCP
jgi:hypothetical protein